MKKKRGYIAKTKSWEEVEIELGIEKVKAAEFDLDVDIETFGKLMKQVWDMYECMTTIRSMLYL